MHPILIQGFGLIGGVCLSGISRWYFIRALVQHLETQYPITFADMGGIDLYYWWQNKPQAWERQWRLLIFCWRANWPMSDKRLTRLAKGLVASTLGFMVCLGLAVIIGLRA